MRIPMIAASLVAILAVPALLAQLADAAPKKKRVVTYQTRVVPAGRARTRVRVEARSFLDAGTEVLPGQRKFTDYAFPPNYSPTSVIENTGAYHRDPLPGPFDLPGRGNFLQW